MVSLQDSRENLEGLRGKDVSFDLNPEYERFENGKNNPPESAFQHSSGVALTAAVAGALTPWAFRSRR